jgi:hypothetical protein
MRQAAKRIVLPRVKPDNIELVAQNLLEARSKLHDPVDAGATRSAYTYGIEMMEITDPNQTYLG